MSETNRFAIWGSETFLGSHLALQMPVEKLTLIESSIPAAYFPELQNAFRISAENQSSESIAENLLSQKTEVLFFIFPEGLHGMEFHQKLWKEFYSLLSVLEKKTQIRRVVFLSSDKVYPFQSETALSETDPLAADDVFASALIGVESLIQSFRRSVVQKTTFGKEYEWLVVRAPNAIGPRDWRESSFLRQLYQSVRNNSDFEIRKPHSQRSWLDVRDLASWMIQLATCEPLFKDTSFPVFNIDNFNSILTVGEVADLSAKILNEVFTLKLNQALTNKGGSSAIKSRSRKMNLSRIENLNLLSPPRKLEETLTDSLRWHHTSSI